MNNSRKRLEKLERAATPGRGDEVIYSDGLEFGFDPIPGGWAVLLYKGLPVKAYPRDMWDAWPPQATEREDGNN